MISFEFSTHADRLLHKLPVAAQRRIIRKIEWYITSGDPLHFAKPLEGRARKRYRFRIGDDYRVIFDWSDRNGGHIRIVWVGLRPRAY